MNAEPVNGYKEIMILAGILHAYLLIPDRKRNMIILKL